ncbi:MAG: hypothetical protein P1P81_11815, partial [Desulfobulbales bacterium]|nr:hypothetical protein [Desulfobulbales bacterium]
MSVRLPTGMGVRNHWNTQVVMPGGIIALNVADIHRFKNAKNPDAPTHIKLMGQWYHSQLRKYGFDLVDIIIWGKNQFWAKRPHSALSDKTIHTRYETLNNCEPVYIFRKRGERELPAEEVIHKSMLTRNEWGPWANSVWKIDAVQNEEQDFSHALEMTAFPDFLRVCHDSKRWDWLDFFERSGDKPRGCRKFR